MKSFSSIYSPNYLLVVFLDSIVCPSFGTTPFIIQSSLPPITHANSNPSLVALLSFKGVFLRFLHLEKKEEGAGAGGHHHHDHPPSNNNNASLDLQWGCVTVVGSCNGLTCNRLPSAIQIINPSTRELLTFPQPKLSPLTSTVGAKHGFGFDPLMNEYKVIQICLDYRTEYHECWVYTLGTNLWRNITATCGYYLPPCRHPVELAPICVNVALFWWTTLSIKILSFDLHHEKFQLISCPQVPQGSICHSLFELEGRPSLVYRHDNLIKDGGVQLTLYMLNEDHHHLHLRGMHTKQQQKEANGSWIRLGYSIHFPKKPDTKCMRIVAFSKQIYLQWVTKDGDFMLCNAHSKRTQKKLSDLKNNCGNIAPYNIILVNHVENLLSLKTFVPPSAGETEINYGSSREAVHENPTTSSACCSKDRKRRQLLGKKRKRLHYLVGCLTIPRWISR